MKAGKLLVGLISGAAAGAVVGLLFAPKKGTETRKKISETSDSYLQEAKNKFNEFADSVSHKVDEVKNKTKAGFSDSKAEQKINEAKAEMNKMQS